VLWRRIVDTIIGHAAEKEEENISVGCPSLLVARRRMDGVVNRDRQQQQQQKQRGRSLAAAVSTDRRATSR